MQDVYEPHRRHLPCPTRGPFRRCCCDVRVRPESAGVANAPERSTRPALSPAEGSEQLLLPPPPAEAAQPQSPGFDTVYEHLDAHVIVGVHLVSALLFVVVLLIFCLLWAKDDWAVASGATRANACQALSAAVLGVRCGSQQRHVLTGCRSSVSHHRRCQPSQPAYFGARASWLRVAGAAEPSAQQALDLVARHRERVRPAARG